MATLEAAFVDARAFLNDTLGGDASALWSNAALQPFVPHAHRELQIKLDLNGIPVIRNKSAVIVVPANTTNLVTAALQPASLIVPISIKEGDHLVTPITSEVSEVDFPPDVVKGTSLNYWSWLNEAIQFVGATTIRDILLFYKGGITIPANSAAAIGFIFGEQYLGPKIAGLAAGSVGNTTALAELTAMADKSIDTIIRYNVNNAQGLPARRMPYRRSRRGSKLIL